jgi:hypothetical protein
MSGVSLPVTRPAGRALLVGSESCRPQLSHLLGQLGFQCGETEDPYAAMAELARHPRGYGSLVLSLTSLYREELQIIATVKRRFPHVDVWLTHTDGRAAALAEAMRLGADGLLTEDGPHRIAIAPQGAGMSPAGSSPLLTIAPASEQEKNTDPDRPAGGEAAVGYYDETSGEPLLTADELRALLQEPPATLPSNGE